MYFLLHFLFHLQMMFDQHILQYHHLFQKLINPMYMLLHIHFNRKKKIKKPYIRTNVQFRAFFTYFFILYYILLFFNHIFDL